MKFPGLRLVVSIYAQHLVSLSVSAAHLKLDHKLFRVRIVSCSLHSANHHLDAGQK